ncbi:MAG: class I SAM-dependent methyltransferase, partial [Gemmatimonadota bacterium]
DANHLVAGLAPRVEPDDPILVVGAGAEACAYLLAAHDGVVTFIDSDFGVVERAENRIAQESLSSTFEAVCVGFGQWLPCISGKFMLVVIDAGTLAVLKPNERRVLLAELQGLTLPGGLHALVPDSLGSGPEGLAGHYASWQRESIPQSGRRTRGAQSRGAMFTKPMAEVADQRRDVRA